MTIDPGSVLLVGPDAPPRLFSGPVDVIEAWSSDDVDDALSAVSAALAAGRHVAGFRAYDAGDGTLPLLWFGVYDEARPVADALRGTAPGSAVGALVPREDRSAFMRGVERVRELIREGDVYQINLTTQFEGAVDGDPLDVFRAVWQNQPVGYGAVIRLPASPAPDRWVLSWSPELFFERDGSVIRTRPMKGTHRRGLWPAQDAAFRERLQADEKSRAENLMIVDLLRNDLSRVCEPGSVVVPRLFDVETYRSVLQMTSTVEGRLRPGVSFGDIMDALFPCGSITGAPKIRAMQRIGELEPGPRGVYCGTIGYAAPGGEARFSVAIRTAVVSDGRLLIGAGAGIVWDSDPAAEYDETVLKTRFLHRRMPDFRLLETMRALPEPRGAGEPSSSSSTSSSDPPSSSTELPLRIPLLEAHLDRLMASANYFGWRLNREAVQSVILTSVQAFFRDHPDVSPGTPADAEELTRPCRVRVTVGGAGDVQVSCTIPPAPPVRLQIGFSTVRVDRSDVFLYHKTTNRPDYDRARAEAEARGLYDVLLLNDAGRVTEGSITNVFVRHGTTWSSPPVEEGLLGGVMRAAFMAERNRLDGQPVAERPLTPEDVRSADEIVLTNAFLGSAPAELVHA
ncbi:MAG: aminodeoxychorismate synthase component I [Rhodothermales bacterium]